MTEEKSKRLWRCMKVAGLLLLCIITLAATATHLYEIAVRHIPLALVYRLADEEPAGTDASLFVTPEAFEEQTRYLYEQGYDFLFASQYASVERLSAVITFDDGYDGSYFSVLPILQKYGARATVFINTDNIGKNGYLTEDMIREMTGSGVFEFCSYVPSYQPSDTTAPEQIREEIQASADRLTSLTGKQAGAIAYQSGAHNDTVDAVVKDLYDIIFTARERNYFPVIHENDIPRHTVCRDMTVEEFARMCRKR